MNIVTKTFKHLHTINKHKCYVFKYSVKAGIPFRGFVHDLSKYSPTEFFESVKYFNGHRSPILFAREDKGYALAWLHHKGRNKHHFEYWEDINAEGRYATFMPYKYAVECICDKLAATKVYLKEKYTDDEPLKYLNSVDGVSVIKIHPGTFEFIETILTKVSKEGISKALKPKYLKETYNKIKKKYFKD